MPECFKIRILFEAGEFQIQESSRKWIILETGLFQLQKSFISRILFEARWF